MKCQNVSELTTIKNRISSDVCTECNNYPDCPKNITMDQTNTIPVLRNAQVNQSMIKEQREDAKKEYIIIVIHTENLQEFSKERVTP